MQFIEAITVSIKTCITTLVAKKFNLVSHVHATQFEGHKFHPYGPSKYDSVCKQTSTHISYLGFPEFIQKYCIIDGEASIIIIEQVCKKSTKGFLCNVFI